VLRSLKRTFYIATIIGLMLSCVPSPLWFTQRHEIGVPLSWLDLRPLLFNGRLTPQQYQATVDQLWKAEKIGPTGARTLDGWGWRWARLWNGRVIAFRVEAIAGNVLLMMAAGVLLRRTVEAWAHRRDPRYRPGHCCGCGYDLTGNETGVCPECGRDVRSAEET
jgi:hypothetical protein